MILPTLGTSITLCGLQTVADYAPIGISGKRVRIAPASALSGSVATGSSNGGFTPVGATGALPVSLNQPFLVDAFPPINDPSISGNLMWDVLNVNGQPGTLSLPVAEVQLLPSVTADPTAGEAALVTVATANGATTVLTLKASLQRLYDTPTLRVNANAVAASHGETMREVVGSGNASNAALQFQLKQSPLTYTSASTTSGVQSTLQLRINNLLWNEVPSFLDSAPGDRVFVTRPSPTGGPYIQFGDGLRGSRTPTGTSNIQAQYRKGIGIAGMVAAGQLTQPLDRPQGLQYVTNPGPATGGADPASPSDAQQSAPLPTLTLGRVVSLEDYQNFALGFPGISLALATWTWFGSLSGIFLTLAGEGGAQLNAADPIVLNLMQAFQSYGLPNVPVLPVSYVPQNFEIGMQVLVNAPTYDPTVVIPQVWQALTAAFAFGQLAPGQSVTSSQVIQIAQQVPGVIAVNLQALNLSGAAGSLVNVLCASGPVPGNASGSVPPAGAQVLLLDPASVGNVVLWS
jgi:predicted phage baseplate assembly protein